MQTVTTMDANGEILPIADISPLEMEQLNYAGAMADLDALIETLAAYANGKIDWRQIEQYMCRNYRPQWLKYKGVK